MSQKYNILILVNFTPDEFPTKLRDFIIVSIGEKVIYSGMCSTSPNGYRPSDLKNWKYVYAWIDEQNYLPVKVIPKHRKFGDCFLLNNGDFVKSRNENPNHLYHKKMNSIFIHKTGGILNKEWRGSAGCITMFKKDLEELMRVIEIENCGLEGLISIKNNSKYLLF